MNRSTYRIATRIHLPHHAVQIRIGVMRSVLKQRLFDAMTGLVPLLTRAVEEVDGLARIVILQRLPRERVIPAPPPVNALPPSLPKLKSIAYLQIRQQGTDNRAREEKEAGDKDERRLLQQHSNTAAQQHPPQPASPHSPFAFGPVPNIRIPFLHGHHKLGVVLGWRTENHAVHPARAHAHQHTKRTCFACARCNCI